MNDDDLNWSDDDDDDDKTDNENYWKVRNVPDLPRKPDPNYETMELKQVYYDFNKPDYKRSKGFHGHVIANPDKRLKGLLEREKIIENDWNFKIPFPYIPAYIMEIIGKDAIYTIWDEFLNHDTDETELIMKNKLESINNKMIDRGYELPFHILKFDHMDKTDYIEFRDIVKQLANYILKTPVENKKSQGMHRCCSLWACQVHGKGVGDDDLKEHISKGDNYDDSICLDIVYKRLKLEKRGRLRIKHIFDIMDFAKIKYDKTYLPQTFWDLKSENLIENANQLQELIETLTVEKIVYADEDPDPIFRLPRWLQDEFKPSEILLFKHQFKLIDIDGGGSIDVDELMLLCESLGTRVTIEEANAMMEEYDIDKSGTIDFIELMMLMFKIKHGTIDLQSNALANAMIEAKTQIRIFEEIEELSRDPPLNCSIYSYGGAPVKCDYLIEAPKDSIYYGGQFLFRVVFLPGYPFKIPDTFMFNRIFHPNFFTQLGGTCELSHLNDLWNATWNTRKLLEHVVELICQPNLDLIPEPLVFAAKTWSWLREDERRNIKKAEEAEKKAEEDAELQKKEDAKKAIEAAFESAIKNDEKEDNKIIIDYKADDKVKEDDDDEEEKKHSESKYIKEINQIKIEEIENKNIINNNNDDLDEKSIGTFASNAESEEWNDEEGLVDILLNNNVVVAEEKITSSRSNGSNNKQEKNDKDIKNDETTTIPLNEQQQVEEEIEEDEHDRDSHIYLAAGDLEGIIKKFSRQEQMHVNVIALYVDSLKTFCGTSSEEKYKEIVTLYMEKFAHHYEIPKEPEPEEPEPIIEEVKEEYTGFWDDDDDDGGKDENSDDDDNDGLGTQDYNNDSSTFYSPGGDGPKTQLFGPSIDSIPQDVIIDKENSLISEL